MNMKSDIGANGHRLYRYLYQSKDFCSRQSLARELNLSLPTVYQNLSRLMEAGLIRDSGEQQSTGGRKASGLSIVPDARVAVGISVTEHRLRLAAADLLLNELAYQEVDNTPIVSFADMGELLAQSLEQFLDRFSIDREKLLGVGVALPAVMSPDSRNITAAPTLRLRDTSLEGLTESIPYPTYVENDATSGGHAELFVRRSGRNMAYLSLENGVGGAIRSGFVPRRTLCGGQPAQRRVRPYVCGAGGPALHLRGSGLSGGLLLPPPYPQRFRRVSGGVFLRSGAPGPAV